MKLTRKQVEEIHAKIVSHVPEDADEAEHGKFFANLCADLLSAMDALEWYGDESNYEWLIGMDNGAKAREVLGG